jgi:hypothetical protein
VTIWPVNEIHPVGADQPASCAGHSIPPECLGIQAPCGVSRLSAGLVVGCIDAFGPVLQPAQTQIFTEKDNL